MPHPPVSPRDDFAHQLRSVRKRSGRTLRELQEITFASDSALSRYLSGKSVPPWNVVVALCEVAGTDPEQLRPSWQLARSSRHPAETTNDSAQALHGLHAAAAGHLAHMVEELVEHARTVTARGEQVPEPLVALQRHGTAAFRHVRAAQQIVDRLLDDPAQPVTTDLSAAIEGGTKK